jgi:NADH:ubiquinone oxidoreductase subunit 6 (subunit J)
MKTIYFQLLHYIGEVIGVFLILVGFLVMFYEPAQIFRPLEIFLLVIGTILLVIGMISHKLHWNRTAGIKAL